MENSGQRQQGGLTQLDDLPVHQHANVLSRPANERWNWTERWYFNLQARSGELIAIVGGGVFRNTRVTESYLCAIADGQQFNHRTTRPVEESALADGFVQFEIVDPMTSWRISADSAEHGTSVDLEFRATNSPFLFKPFWVGPDRDADDYDQYEHFVQPGTFTGTMTVGGVEVNTGTVPAFRDRTWGVRSRRPRLHNWIVLHLSDGSFMTLVHQEAQDGRVLFSHAGLVEADGREERLEVESHDLVFDGVSRMPKEGTFTLRGPKGIRTLRLTAIGEGIRGIGAGYDPNQGTKRDNSSDINYSVFDLADEQVVEKVGRGTIDTGVLVELSGADSRSGIGTWETALGRSHPRYGEQIAEIK